MFNDVVFGVMGCGDFLDDFIGDVVFVLVVGEISGVVDGCFVMVIVNVVEVVFVWIMLFDEVKVEIIEDFVCEQVECEIFDFFDEVEDVCVGGVLLD